jgi:hypothetical protein
MKIKDSIVIKGGKFQATLSNVDILDSKVAELLADGLSFNGERGGWSKVFRGVKDRMTVAYSDDAAKVVEAKLTEAFKDFGTMTITIAPRVLSPNAGGTAAAARKAYDEMIALGVSVEIATAVAKKVDAKFDPAAKAEVLLAGMEAKTEVEEKAEEQPSEA